MSSSENEDAAQSNRAAIPRHSQLPAQSSHLSVTVPRLSARKWIVVIVVAAFVIGAAAVYTVPTFVFSRQNVAQALGDAVSGEARFDSFHNVYFPHPGCVAEGVTIRRSTDVRAPLIAASKLIIVGNYSTIFSKHVAVMKAEGLQITPSGGQWPESRSKSSIVIDRFVADDAVLEADGSRNLRFLVHHFAIGDLGSKAPMVFEVHLSNPLPPGEITAGGKLGPWHPQHGDTAVEGSYSFRNADLGAIQGIGGILSSDGNFKGTIDNLDVTGTTDTPEFEVKTNQHRFPLSTSFQAKVNAANGDVILKHVTAKLRETELAVQGTVLPDPQQHRRTAALDVHAQNGRIQDVLFPFVNARRSPLNGETSWRAHIVLPSGHEPFRRRVSLEGDFGITDARFTNPRMQANLDKASVSARGKPEDDDPADVLSDLKGHVALKDGTATFSHLSFAVPGALAQLHGTYNLVNKRVDLHGIVQMQAKVSDATTGVKSFLLKALSPFIKKNKPASPLPVAITGTYDHPQYSISITKKQERRGM